MKTRYKYIHFEELHLADGPLRYFCLNNKDGGELGYVEYYESWQTWVFSADHNCVFNSSCLRDIADFMKQLGAPEKSKE